MKWKLKINIFRYILLLLFSEKNRFISKFGFWFFWGGEKTKINVYEKKPEPQEGKEYVITKVESGKGQYGEYIRVTLKDSEEKEYSTALWIKDTVSAKSKAGAFAIALGNNPEEWEGKRIKIISWTAKNREIIAIENKKVKQ